MSRYVIIPASEEHDLQLAEMSKIAMPGMISLALEKSPSYLNAIKLNSEIPAVFVCIDTSDNSIAATMNIGQRRKSKGGKWVWQKYLSDLRLAPSQRGSRLLYYILSFVAENNFLEESEPSETIIFTDNKPMINYAFQSALRQKSISSIPVYHFAHDYLTYTIAAKRSKSRNKNIRIVKASSANIENLKTFHHKNALQQDGSHYIDWYKLDSGHYAGLKEGDFQIAYKEDEIVGIMGTWNQMPFKRSRIVDYAPALKLLRPLLNFFSPLRGALKLPAATNCIEVLSVVGMSIEKDDPEIFKALLIAHLNQLKISNPQAFLQIGLDAESPFNKCIKGIRGKHITEGKIFYVTTKHKPENMAFYSRLEVARI